LDFLLEERAHLRRGAHYLFVGGYIERRELLKRNAKEKASSKGKKEQRQGTCIRINTK
jgi:hypothetical protein